MSAKMRIEFGADLFVPAQDSLLSGWSGNDPHSVRVLSREANQKSARAALRR